MESKIDEPYHQRTIQLFEPRTGQFIMDAMQAMAQEVNLTPIYACGYGQEVVEQSVNEIAAALEVRLK